MFKGSLVALVTPMDAQGRIDYHAYEKLIDWHISQGTDGLVILGTTGEAATVMKEERVELIRVAVREAKNRLPIIVGTGTNSTNQTVELTEEAMKLGADAALIVTPYYNKPTQEGLYQHFKTIATAVALPQILYNVPGRTACDLLPETVARLAAIPNIIGIKEATGQLARLTAILSLAPNLDVFSGDDGTAFEWMLHGAKGVISVAANVAPRAFHELCALTLAARASHDKPLEEKAYRLDHKLRHLYQALFLESNPIPTKWALHKMGMISEGIRLPLTPLSSNFHAELQQALQEAEL
jgi:4-hydroxy-tetrahydrodipicolinate synthase